MYEAMKITGTKNKAQLFRFISSSPFFSSVSFVSPHFDKFLESM